VDLEILVAADATRRAALIHLTNALTDTPTVSLSSTADLSEYAPGVRVTTELGAYTVDKGGVLVTDYTPPLGVPVAYTAKAGTTVVQADITIDHGQYVWVKSKRYSHQPIGLLLKSAPSFTFNAETHTFYGLSEATKGLGYGQSGVRRPGQVEMTFYSWTAEEASRLRNLIRDNPLCVQWPGVIDDEIQIAPWYLLQDVSRTAIGPPLAEMFEWSWTLNPVHATAGVFSKTVPTYQSVLNRGWASYAAMDADEAVSTYTHAQMAAAAYTGPPLPEGETGEAFLA
jgi:hypothetical protein